MNRGEYQEIRASFLKARELPQQERDAFLQQQCGHKPSLLAAVRRLLDRDAEGSRLLEDTIPSALVAFPAGSCVDETPPWENIGQYQLTRTLGSGGMGVVYEARQGHPNRLVALKVMRETLEHNARRRRFYVEIEVLGRLQHPGIAAIYEAGSFDASSGMHPFFAMELVQGRGLTEHVDTNSLDLHARLRLFVKLCEAVQYAHNQGVVHRDLKPGNVLVTADGQPKILDFGIAKITDFDTRAAASTTGDGHILGTLQYMSPEQASGDSKSIDTRTDVYTLGFILYEMLAGRKPYDVSGQETINAIRMVQEQAVPRLSTINQALRGDIETIILKALRKDPERRYATVESLAEDIRRFLDSRPIEARPPSAIYQARMFARRHRSLVGGAVATVAAALIGLVGISIYAAEARVQRDAARQEAVTLGNALRVLEGVMIGADPFLGNTGDAKFQGLSQHDPKAIGALTELAFQHLDQERPVQAEREFRLALALGRGLHDTTDASMAVGLRGLARASEAHARLRETESQLRRAIDELTQDERHETENTIGLESALAANLLGQQRFDESVSLLRQVVNRVAADKAENRVRYFDAQLLLVDVFVESGKFRDAEMLLRDLLMEVSNYLSDPALALEIQDIVYEARVTIKYVGTKMKRDGAADAYRVILEHYEQCERQLPPEHFVRIHAEYTLARALISLGKGMPAERHLRNCHRVLQSMPPSPERTKHEKAVKALFDLLEARRKG